MDDNEVDLSKELGKEFQEGAFLSAKLLQIIESYPDMDFIVEQELKSGNVLKITLTIEKSIKEEGK